MELAIGNYEYTRRNWIETQWYGLYTSAHYLYDKYKLILIQNQHQHIIDVSLAMSALRLPSYVLHDIITYTLHEPSLNPHYQRIHTIIAINEYHRRKID